MPNALVKISELPIAQTLTGGELIPILQEGNTCKAPINTLKGEPGPQGQTGLQGAQGIPGPAGTAGTATYSLAQIRFIGVNKT